jgi:hypothetical protein
VFSYDVHYNKNNKHCTFEKFNGVIRFYYDLIYYCNVLKVDGPTKVAVIETDNHNLYELFTISYLDIERKDNANDKETFKIFYSFMKENGSNKMKEHFAEIKKLIYDYKLKKRLLKTSHYDK